MSFAMFTPYTGLAGGAIIGLAAGTLLLWNCDILGASGIISSTTLQPSKALSDPSLQWKLVFISSMLLTTNLIFGNSFHVAPMPRANSQLATLLAGVLVGFGTKLGNGCTTGHGICGLARFSKRSLASVCTFMGAAILSTYLTTLDGPLGKYVKFLHDSDPTHNTGGERVAEAGWGLTLGVLTLAVYSVMKMTLSRRNSDSEQQTPLLKNNNKKNQQPKQSAVPPSPQEVARRKIVPAAAGGALFSAGLHISGMIQPAKVMNFLNVAAYVQDEWDPTLMLVMGGGLVTSTLAYQIRQRVLNNKPLALPEGAVCGVPSSTVIDAQLLTGAFLFGTGWGIGGICPGPSILLAGLGIKPILMQWFPAFLVGSYTANHYKKSYTGC